MSRTDRTSTPLPGLVLCSGAALCALAGLVSLSLIDQVVLLGIAVVLPLALGGSPWRWTAAAAIVLCSFLVDEGWAGFAVLPFAVLAVRTVAGSVRQAGPLYFWRLADLVPILAGAYAVVAAGALSLSRFGLDPFDIGEPIVELTAVHYLYAGVAALALAEDARHDAAERWPRLGAAAVVLTAAAPPVVAVGFVTHAAVPQVGGAVLMALGVFATATLELRFGTARSGLALWRTALITVSGLAVWVPMALAIAWAAGQHWDVPALSVPDMARTHGLANSLAFVLCGLIGRRLGNGNTARSVSVAA